MINFFLYIVFSFNDNKDFFVEVLVFYVKFLICFEYLGNLFFIECLMIKYYFEYNMDFLDIFFEMVFLMFVFWIYKD